MRHSNRSITGMPIVEVNNLKESVQQPVVKVLMVENPEHLQTVESKLQHQLEGQLINRDITCCGGLFI